MQGGKESGEPSRQLSWKLTVFRKGKGEGIPCSSYVGCGLCGRLWPGDSYSAAAQLEELRMCGGRVGRIPA